MPISSDLPAITYGVQVEKMAQDQQKREGAQAVELIKTAAPSVGVEGQGTLVDVLA